MLDSNITAKDDLNDSACTQTQTQLPEQTIQHERTCIPQKKNEKNLLTSNQIHKQQQHYTQGLAECRHVEGRLPETGSLFTYYPEVDLAHSPIYSFTTPEGTVEDWPNGYLSRVSAPPRLGHCNTTSSVFVLSR
jgi:hypothetical protein